MKAYEATYTVPNNFGNKGDTKTILVGGNSLRHAAVKADEQANANSFGDLIKLEETDKVIL